MSVPDDLIGIGRAMVAAGLTWGNAGNLSYRSGPDTLMVTASGARLGELGRDDLVECLVAAGGAGAADEVGALSGARRPSKELPLHRAVYAARPDANAVLHGAPFHATLAACSELTVPDGLFVESMYYLEKIARVPYHHPGSEALGAAVGEHALHADVLLLENHGVVVLGDDLDEALQALQVLEFACRLVVAARSAGATLRPVPAATAADFRDGAAYKPRRHRPGEAGS